MSKTLQHLSLIASYLRVPAGKLSFDTFSLPVRTYNNTSVTGFLSIIVVLVQESNCNCLGKTIEDQAEVYQWLEYIDVYINPSSTAQITTELLPGLNGVLKKKTFLVSNKVTIADIAMYYALYSVMENITHIEKEKYINVCRWFDNLQQDNLLRQKNNIINFNSSFLCTIAPARH